MAQIQSLAQELPYAASAAIKIKKNKQNQPQELEATKSISVSFGELPRKFNYDNSYFYGEMISSYK